MKPLFSITTIAKNEAGTLPKRLLPSLEEFLGRGGEAVLLDTGSTDGTPEIAEAGGFRVHREGSRFMQSLTAGECDAINGRFADCAEEPVVAEGDAFFNFKHARNHAAGLASNDYVLIADCDEGFTKLDIDAINGLIEAKHRKIDIPYVHSHDADGRPAVRFHRAVFYDRQFCYWTCCVHEVVTGNVPTFYADPSIILLEHWQEAHGHRANYLKGLAWDCLRNPDKDRQCHYFARELLWSGRFRCALLEFKRHIALESGWQAEKGMSAIYCGDCMMALGNEEEAVRWWHKAVTLVPDSRQPWMRLANYYYAKREHQLAASHAAAALAVRGGGYYFEWADHYRSMPHEILYVSLWWLGDKEGSKRHWEKALSFTPNNPKYLADASFYQSLCSSQL